MIEIHCKYDELIDPKKIKDFEKNPNKHGDDQIARLAEIYKYQGIRHPIIVCPDRKVIAAGHGRKLAAIRAGIKEFPIVYQKFASDEQFYAFVTSDNAISLWADLDFSMINDKIADLGPDFDLELLGIKEFTLDPSDKIVSQDEVEKFSSTIEGNTRNVILCFTPEEYDEFVKLSKRIQTELQMDSLTDAILKVMRDVEFQY